MGSHFGSDPPRENGNAVWAQIKSTMASSKDGQFISVRRSIGVAWLVVLKQGRRSRPRQNISTISNLIGWLLLSYIVSGYRFLQNLG
jgi:hypothetical protein